MARKIERQLGELQERQSNPVVKDKPAEEYLRGFTWDQFRFPLRAQLRELVDAVQKQVFTLDEELKEKVRREKPPRVCCWLLFFFFFFALSTTLPLFPPLGVE